MMMSLEAVESFFSVKSIPCTPPLIVDSVAPEVVRSSRKDGTGAHIGGFDYDFTFDLDKLNIPTVAGTTATFALQGATTGPFAATSTALSWDGPPWAEDSVATVTAAGVTIDADIDTEALTGTLTLSGGTDSNGHPYSQTISLPSIVLIDNLAPLIQDFEVEIPSGQLQIKSGDVITFTGDIVDPQSSPTLDFIINGTVTDKVTLQQSEPFEIQAVCTDVFTVDGYKRLEEKGVHDIVTLPWLMYGTPIHADLEKKKDGMKRFAEDYIAKL